MIIKRRNIKKEQQRFFASTLNSVKGNGEKTSRQGSHTLKCLVLRVAHSAMKNKDVNSTGNRKKGKGNLF